jgi:hypothetical protein
MRFSRAAKGAVAVGACAALAACGTMREGATPFPPATAGPVPSASAGPLATARVVSAAAPCSRSNWAAASTMWVRVLGLTSAMLPMLTGSCYHRC